MKTIPIALAAEYAAAASTLCACLKVTRTDGVVVGFTSLDAKLTVDGVVYQPGFDPSDIVSESTLSVGNLELTILPDSPGGLAVERADLIAGLWDGAAFEIFECNWKAPADGVNLLKFGTMGDAQAMRGNFTIELRGPNQAFQQPVGAVTSKTCRYRLGSTSLPLGLCKVDLSAFTFEYAVTAVTSRYVVAASAATEADDYYGEGLATALDGANAGYTVKVKDFAAGVFTLSLPFPFTVQVGDTLRVVAGCRKRHSRTLANPTGVSDCVDKFDNLVNFGGEPHVPGADLLLADPEVAV